MAKAKKQSFEESLAELEAIVERMESGELSLESSLEAFENGMKLSRDAQAALSAAELKVQKPVSYTHLRAHETSRGLGDVYKRQATG